MQMAPYVFMQFVTLIRDSIYFLFLPIVITAILITSDYGYENPKWKIFVFVNIFVFLSFLIWQISLNVTMSVHAVYKKVKSDEYGSEIEL